MLPVELDSVRLRLAIVSVCQTPVIEDQRFNISLIIFRKLAKMILAILSCLSKSVAANHDSIDTILPSLMQILGILNEVNIIFSNRGKSTY